MKSAFSFKRNLFVLVHAGHGHPFAARIQARRVVQVLALVTTVFAVTSAGTLMFFRELEINRRLEDRLLDYQTRETLAVPYPSSPSAPALPVLPLQPRIVATGETEAAPIEGALPELTVSGTAEARVTDLAAQCQTGECTVRFALSPTKAQPAQGQSLVILETEIPRIGSASAGTEIRKRYFFHPGKASLDSVTEEAILKAERKPFKFTKALQTSVVFTVGKLLRPLAANIYLFDAKGSLVHHERKIVESEEGL